MNENEKDLVLDESAENVEQTTEETPKIEKTYTQAEVDAIVGKKKARLETKIRKEYDRKYGDLEEVLRAGTGKESVDDMTDTFKKFYQSKGVQIPEKPKYTARDLETLAKSDADEFISEGFDAVIEEADRLKDIGAANMTEREKAVFRILAEHVQNTERGNELAKIGVTADVYNSKEFKDFQSMFTKDTPLSKVYEMYAKTTQPKKEYKQMGSMKATPASDNGVKDYYSYEEAIKFTKKDFDKNPALYKAVQNSMTKW